MTCVAKCDYFGVAVSLMPWVSGYVKYFSLFNKNVLEAIAIGMKSSILGNFLSIGNLCWKAEEQTNPFPETLVTYIDNK